MPKAKSEVKLKPLMGYCLVEPSSAETTTSSGIYLPESSQERPAQGKVLSIGEDLHLPGGSILGAPVKVGDIVVYKKWAGDEIKLNGKEFKLVSFSDLMGVIEE